MLMLYFACLSDQVYQTADMFSKPEGTAKINCSHSIENYNRILWYKQYKNLPIGFHLCITPHTWNKPLKPMLVSHVIKIKD